MSTTTLPAQDLESRLIRFADWVPCKAAFIDCKTPGSDQKDNYSFVGAGVSQNADQYVNVSIPHGFQLGAAGMPKGVSNSLHLHFTAEVFVNLGGEFQLRWGPRGEQGNYISRDGDVISVPTWIFRGFTNIGPDEGILYTTLGRDDTGGIIWGPQVLRDAEGHGLYLGRDNKLISIEDGQGLPTETDRIIPLSDELLDELDVFTEDDFRTRVVTREDRKYSDHAFLCSPLPGGGAKLALVIGYGLSEDRRQTPNIHEPHGFSAAWLSAEAGEGMLTHSISVEQTLTCAKGRWQVVLNTGDDEVVVDLGERDALSIPAGVARRFECLEPGDTGQADLYVVTAGDGRVEIDWDESVTTDADSAGVALDPNHYVAPVSFLVSAGLRAIDAG